MNIIKNKKIVKSFGQQIDMLNTLGGGISMAHAAVAKKNDRLEVMISAPSVNPESFHVVVDYDKLIIYGTLPVKDMYQKTEGSVVFPLFTNVLSLPFETDVENIRAVYEAGKLRVILPFAAGRSTRNRAIDIE